MPVGNVGLDRQNVNSEVDNQQPAEDKKKFNCSFCTRIANIPRSGANKIFIAVQRTVDGISDKCTEAFLSCWCVKKNLSLHTKWTRNNYLKEQINLISNYLSYTNFRAFKKSSLEILNRFPSKTTDEIEDIIVGDLLVPALHEVSEEDKQRFSKQDIDSNLMRKGFETDRFFQRIEGESEKIRHYDLVGYIHETLVPENRVFEAMAVCNEILDLPIREKIMGELIRAMVLKGFEDDALERIDTDPLLDDEGKSRLYYRFIKSCLDDGTGKIASQITDRTDKALLAAEQISSNKIYNKVLNLFVIHFSNCSRFDLAIEIAASVETDSLKDDMFEEITESSLDDFKLAEALEAASQATDPASKAMVLCRIVHYLLEPEHLDLEMAIEKVLEIPETILKDYFYKKISDAFVKEKRPLDAVEMAEKITDIDKKNSANNLIAYYFMDELEFEFAMEIAERITEEIWKSEVLDEISELCISEERIEEALEAALKITDSDNKSIALSRLVNYYINCEDLESARELALLIPIEDEKDSKLANISSVYSLQGLTDEALEIANRIKDPFCQSQAYLDICKDAIEMGNPVAAYDISKQMRDKKVQSEAFAMIAANFTLRAQLYRAKQIIEEISDPEIRDEAIQTLNRKYKKRLSSGLYDSSSD